MTAPTPIINAYTDLENIENKEPDPDVATTILAHTTGAGFRILVYSPRQQKINDWHSPWCIRSADGTYREDRLAIHRWAYLS